MAITAKELEISNKSYTNKDFESIYTEILDIAEKLSTRFSPANSNESDPFVILLKLLAFVSDKVNYNVDKNILEQFMLSCTQETSMRELADMLGYNVRYYRSSNTSVIFKYDFSDLDASIKEIKIPATSIVSDGTSIQFITLSNATISRETGISEEIDVIQGILKTLTVLDSSLIQLENLNSRNIIYLPEPMIAENGIFISNSANNSWEASDNLNTELYGSCVYKFGFDSDQNLPYLEFPEWIGDIINEGLTIKYLVTDGIAGNVGVKALTSVSRVNAEDDSIDDSNIEVINSFAASDGADPETIDESYAGFKKIIGTFDTLVTCRDYANAIYNLIDSQSKPIVSNVIVSDRRSDINYSCNVLTVDGSNTQLKTIISKSNPNFNISGNILIISAFSNAPEILDEATYDKYKNTILYTQDTSSYYECIKASAETITYSWEVIDDISSKCLDKIYYNQTSDEYITLKKQSLLSDSYAWVKFDTESSLSDVIDSSELCIYPLKPISNTSYIAYNDADGYEQSFDMIDKDDINSEIVNNYAIDNYQTMSHKFKDLKDSDIFTIRNNYKLDCVINTTEKVTILEEQEIIANINNAIIKAYNPRNLNFGYEIVFDELIETIQNSDARIKNVSLQEPTQTPSIITVDGVEHSLKNSSNITNKEFKIILAKNILSGKISVFSYDSSFNYSYAYSDLAIDKNIVSLESKCNIDSISPEDDSSNTASYVLKANEVVQLITPKLITKQTYPYGIEYSLKLNALDYIPKNSIYKLTQNDEITFKYTNTNDEEVTITYSYSDDIYINPNVDLYDTTYRKEVLNETPSSEGSSSQYFYVLDTKDEVKIQVINNDKLTSFKKCYWLTNSDNNKINWTTDSDGSGYYILNDGEYFFYTDTSLSMLFAYGSGTKIKINSINSYPENFWTHSSYIDIESINKNGLSAIQNYFINIDFSDNNMEIIQNDVLTLIEGDELVIDFSNVSDKQLMIKDNEFSDIDSNISLKYKVSSSTNYVDIQKRSSEIKWQIKSMLDINSGPDTPQVLEGNQSIKFIQGDYNLALKKFVKSARSFTLSAKSSPNTFKSNVNLQMSGSSDINVQYLDLDLKYKCPSIMSFTEDYTVNNYLENLGNGFNFISFNKLPLIIADELKSVTADIYVSSTSNSNISSSGSSESKSRILMINNLNDSDVTITLTAYKKSSKDNYEEISAISRYNSIITPEIVSSIVLNYGLNVIKISDTLDNICSKISLKLDYKNELPNNSLIISDLKVIDSINPYLNLDNSDDIIEFIRETYPEQFKVFAICADLDYVRQIDVSEEFKIDSAQAFYDSNNIANKWVIPKIDLASSNIRISRNSKKSLM